MNQTSLWALFLAWLMSVPFIGFAGSAQAETAWRTMHAGANPPTIAAALQQCLDAGVPVGECHSFAGMLETGQCKQVSVSDGIRYRWLGGPDGKISRDKVKALGGTHAALRCVLSSRRTLDWYHVSVTGSGACNNAGEPVLQSKMFIAPPSHTVRRAEVIDTPGLLVPLGCPECCTDETIYLPGSRVVIETQQSSGLAQPIQLN